MVNILKGDKIFIPKRPGEPNTTHANINKASSTLKWKPKTSLEDGLKIVLTNIFYWKKRLCGLRTKLTSYKNLV